MNDGFEREGAGEADALALPAAEFVRIALVLRRVEPDTPSSSVDALAPRGRGRRAWITSGSSTIAATRMRGLSDEYGS